MLLNVWHRGSFSCYVYWQKSDISLVILDVWRAIIHSLTGKMFQNLMQILLDDRVLFCYQVSSRSNAQIAVRSSPAVWLWRNTWQSTATPSPTCVRCATDPSAKSAASGATSSLTPTTHHLPARYVPAASHRWSTSDHTWRCTQVMKGTDGRILLGRWGSWEVQV